MGFDFFSGRLDSFAEVNVGIHAPECDVGGIRQFDTVARFGAGKDFESFARAAHDFSVGEFS
jgi:hypothetical protein